VPKSTYESWHITDPEPVRASWFTEVVRQCNYWKYTTKWGV